MISIKNLSNGIKIVMEEMQQLNSVSCGIWVKTGSCDENQKVSGISHFVEHMMFKGTETRDAFTISKEMDSIGAQMNAFTGKEATCFYVKSTSDNFYKACDILTDMLENSVFDKKELDRERHVIEEEIKMVKDEPDDFASEELSNGLFAGTSLANSVTGTATSIRRVTHDVMSGYVRDQYVRDSIVVSVAGKFDPDEVSAYFENKFKKMKGSKHKRKKERSNVEPFYRSFVRDINQAHVSIGTKSLSLADKRSYTFQVLNNILGGSMSSRLFQNIREKKGLAYTVISSSGNYTNDGYFEIYLGVSPSNISKAISGIREELDKLSSEQVSTEELESSKEQMKSNYFFSQESTTARMIVNGKNLLLLDKVYMPDEVLDGFNSVSKDDIDELKGTICDLDTYSAVIVSPERVPVKRIMTGN